MTMCDFVCICRNLYEYAEEQKVRQPGNLVARKSLKNPILAERFWSLLLNFPMMKQFGGSIKEIMLAFL